MRVNGAGISACTHTPGKKPVQCQSEGVVQSLGKSPEQR
jgi:hypothetical protein